ncbi:hypothetical protein CEUSTIGMA_g10876.t1 [Chlamydomonas eustigma]|uniref:Uncharacterized protein n=1 Tax=Chlamydomonas eustigma TaxID=1157962 RepID=A0A250XK37_9CHLO|nr:hypothetical protein CEUSTIGMA_g10876.t1 [Chlamydomonas eustigma]|eukprot:GAX83451.1 hypothetical protein CEUSTIGMA_g10876.t1 [Chlamydomonas eustigma]
MAPRDLYEVLSRRGGLHSWFRRKLEEEQEVIGSGANPAKTQAPAHTAGPGGVLDEVKRMVDSFERDATHGVLTKENYFECRQFIVNGSILRNDSKRVLLECRSPIVLKSVFHKANSMNPRRLKEVLSKNGLKYWFRAKIAEEMNAVKEAQASTSAMPSWQKGESVDLRNKIREMVEAFDRALVLNINTKDNFQACRRFIKNGSLLDSESREALLSCTSPSILRTVFHKANSMGPRSLYDVLGSDVLRDWLVRKVDEEKSVAHLASRPAMSTSQAPQAGSNGTTSHIKSMVESFDRHLMKLVLTDEKKSFTSFIQDGSLLNDETRLFLLTCSDQAVLSSVLEKATSLEHNALLQVLDSPGGLMTWLKEKLEEANTSNASTPLAADGCTMAAAADTVPLQCDIKAEYPLTENGGDDDDDDMVEKFETALSAQIVLNKEYHECKRYIREDGLLNVQTKRMLKGYSKEHPDVLADVFDEAKALDSISLLEEMKQAPAVSAEPQQDWHAVKDTVVKLVETFNSDLAVKVITDRKYQQCRKEFMHEGSLLNEETECLLLKCKDPPALRLAFENVMKMDPSSLYQILCSPGGLSEWFRDQLGMRPAVPSMPTPSPVAQENAQAGVTARVKALVDCFDRGLALRVVDEDKYKDCRQFMQGWSLLDADTRGFLLKCRDPDLVRSVLERFINIGPEYLFELLQEPGRTKGWIMRCMEQEKEKAAASSTRAIPAGELMDQPSSIALKIEGLVDMFDRSLLKHVITDEQYQPCEQFIHCGSLLDMETKQLMLECKEPRALALSFESIMELDGVALFKVLSTPGGLKEWFAAVLREASDTLSVAMKDQKPVFPDNILHSLGPQEGVDDVVIKMVDSFSHQFVSHVTTKEHYQCCVQYIQKGSLVDSEARKVLLTCISPSVLMTVFHKAKSMNPKSLSQVLSSAGGLSAWFKRKLQEETEQGISVSYTSSSALHSGSPATYYTTASATTPKYLASAVGRQPPIPTVGHQPPTPATTAGVYASSQKTIMNMVDVFDRSFADHISPKEQFRHCQKFVTKHGVLLDQETKELLVQCRDPHVLQVVFHKAKSLNPRSLLEVLQARCLRHWFVEKLRTEMHGVGRSDRHGRRDDRH